MKSIEELSQTSKDTSIQKLREEFNKKSFYSENHPKTSHEYKRSIMNSTNLINNKRFQRTNKAFSALKFNQKWNNSNKLNDKDFLEFYRKHPGYLYYKEIVSNMKIKQVNKKRAFTGKDINFNNKKYLYKKNNFSNTNYNYNYNYNKSDKFPKINRNKNINYFNGQKKQKWKKITQIRNYNYNFNYNNYNHNHNYNINNININFKDKKNPYSLSWVNKILNQNDYKLEIKEKNKGMPKIVLNNNNINNKVIINNYIEKKENKEEKKINKNENKDDDNKEKKDEFVDNDDLDEEQQMQFYKNQKNFFKARKDIKEEPEDLEEDKDDDDNKNNDKNNVNNNQL